MNPPALDKLPKDIIQLLPAYIGEPNIRAVSKGLRDDIPKEYVRFKCVVDINCKVDGTVPLPTAISLYPNLHYLVVVNIELEHVKPKDLNIVSNIKILHTKNSLVETFKIPKHVKKAGFAKCEELLTIEDCDHLQELQINGCNDLTLHENHATMSSLTHLFLSDTCIDELPLLPCLQWLELTDTPIKTVGSYLKLKTLLVTRSDEFSAIHDCPELQNIYCSDCDQFSAMWGLPALRELTLRSCVNLEAIPDCPKLESIICIDCPYLDDIFVTATIKTFVCEDCPKAIIHIKGAEDLENIVDICNDIMHNRGYNSEYPYYDGAFEEDILNRYYNEITTMYE